MITELVIDRKLWMRGGYKRFSTNLLSTTKKKADGEQYICCLGFLCLAQGMKEKDISGHPGPRSIDKGNEEEGWWHENRRFINPAMEVNDDSNISDSEREAKLIPAFQEVGITLSFIGEQKKDD